MMSAARGLKELKLPAANSSYLILSPFGLRCKRLIEILDLSGGA
jgi:hypothetical protein